MNGHFIPNLLNKPLTSFINFRWNDHERFCLSYDPLKNDCEHHFNKKMLFLARSLSIKLHVRTKMLLHIVIQFL